MNAGPTSLIVVGAGRVTRAVHLPLLRDLADLFRVVAVVDTELPRAVDAVAGFEGAIACGDLDDALATGAAAVLCATPWYAHAEIVLRALRAGRQVLCEKPVTLDRTELRTLVAAERECAGTAAVGYMKRHDPAVRSLLEEIQPNRLGLRQVLVRVVDPNSPQQVRALLPPGFPISDSAAPQAAQRAVDRALGGGIGMAARQAFAHAVGGSLVHHINLVHALLDGTGLELAGSLSHAVHWSAGRSVACGWRPSTEFAAQLSYVRVPGSRLYSETIDCVTESELFTLSAGSPYSPEGGFTLHVDGKPAYPRPSRPATVAEGFRRQLCAWAAALATGAPALPGLSEALRDLDVVHEVVAALN